MELSDTTLTAEEIDRLFAHIDRQPDESIFDLQELLPFLLSDDPEERDAARKTFTEILCSKPGKLIRFI